MTVTLNLKNRRCGNRAPHKAHSWRGLNTRGAGYYCVGRDPEYNIDPDAPDVPADESGPPNLERTT